MFKSDIPCKGKGETCSNLYIQNKKYHLCSDCVYEKNHGGKSRHEVMNEKIKNTFKIKAEHSGEWNNKKNISYKISKEEIELLQNKINQDNIKEIDQKEEDNFFEKERQRLGIMLVDKYGNKSVAKKPRKPIKKTKKQTEIDRLYKATCIDMDYVTEKLCTGCLRYQGGDIKLSHSHIISRADCKAIGRPELIYERDNLTYHCLDFGENKGCHRMWENPKYRHWLDDYEKNLAYIKEVAPELLEKYLAKTI